jgi:hypothetical protein
MATHVSERRKKFIEHCKKLGTKYHSEALGTTEFVHPMGRARARFEPYIQKAQKRSGD